MSDGEILLLIFAAIYLCDCFLWEKRTSLGFVSPWRRRWRLRRPGEGFGNDRGGLLFLWPLPPLGTVFVVPQPEVVFAPCGIGTVSVESPNPGCRVAQPHRFVAWADVGTVEWEERQVFVSGAKFVRCGSTAQAARLARRIKRLSRMEDDARQAAIRIALRASLRPGRVKTLAALFFKGTGALRFLCVALFAVGFVAVPLTYRWWGAERPTFVALGLLLLLMLQGTVETFCLHRKFFPKSRGERWQHLFVQIMLPQHGMRAIDFLCRHWLDRFHPLAVASVLLKTDAFRAFAGSYYRDLRHPVPFHDADHAAASQALAYRDATLLPAVEDFLREQGIEPGDLLPPGPDMETEAKSHCPRCLASYIIDNAICDECGEMPSIPVAAPPSESTA